MERPRLLRILDGAIGHGLGIVIAPPGFGKTTLLSQWRAHALGRGIAVAWLSLDEDDNDTAQFLSYVALALVSSGVESGRLTALTREQLADASTRSALEAIFSAVQGHTTPVVLVLDDFQRAGSREISNLVNEIVLRRPDNFAVLLNSHTRPSLDFPRLLAAGHAIEVTVAHLRLTSEETRAALDRDIPVRELALLVDRTEGWPIAVQLARLLVQGDAGDLEESLRRLKGDSGHFAGYLSDQIVATLSAQAREFLMRTSIVERVSAELASVLMPSVNAWDMLVQLTALNALIVPIEDAGGYFRYHPLFAEYLRDQLRRREPQILSQLHTAASDWFEQAGQIQQAVSHAKQAGDWSRCARLIEAAGGWQIILFTGIGALRKLLEGFPAQAVKEFPRLCVALAYLALKDGKVREAQNHLATAEARGLRTTDDEELSRDLLNVSILVGIYEDRWLTTAAVRHLETLLLKLSRPDNLSLGIVHSGLFHAYLAQGDFSRADDAMVIASKFLDRANTATGQNYGCLHAGVSAFHQGRFRLAESLFRESAERAMVNFGVDSGIKYISDVLLSALLFWRGQTHDAAFEHALHHVEQFDGWLEIFAIGLDWGVEMALLQGDFVRCHAALDRAKRVSSDRGIPRLSVLADAKRIRVQCAQKDFESATPLVARLERDYSETCWVQEPGHWRPLMEAALALSSYYKGRSLHRALSPLKGAIECARSIGAQFHLVRQLLMRAQLLLAYGRRPEAGQDLREALSIATPEGIVTPFLNASELRSLLPKTTTPRHGGANDDAARFVTSLTELWAAQSRPASAASHASSLFSPRELDVLRQLCAGRTNKEVARIANITESTVKFHTKNIFSKLVVKNRAEAVAKARDLGIADP
ncbi:MAG TPA: LuxR C-terminal-related transcriptional regulator [Steroidobacteraceae bacterium]|nr:LuxR C-terminal-related transcriptional regulator [Steroidobacteraceae bacterium]